jgi:hypothetical protein
MLFFDDRSRRFVLSPSPFLRSWQATRCLISREVQYPIRHGTGPDQPVHSNWSRHYDNVVYSILGALRLLRVYHLSDQCGVIEGIQLLTTSTLVALFLEGEAGR